MTKLTAIDNIGTLLVIVRTAFAYKLLYTDVASCTAVTVTIPILKIVTTLPYIDAILVFDEKNWNKPSESLLT